MKYNYRYNPTKEAEPYTYDKYRRLGILSASPLERLIMLELYQTIGASDWLFQREEPSWEVNDMREFVRDLAAKIKQEKL